MFDPFGRLVKSEAFQAPKRASTALAVAATIFEGDSKAWIKRPSTRAARKSDAPIWRQRRRFLIEETGQITDVKVQVLGVWWWNWAIFWDGFRSTGSTFGTAAYIAASHQKMLDMLPQWNETWRQTCEAPANPPAQETWAPAASR